MAAEKLFQSFSLLLKQNHSGFSRPPLDASRGFWIGLQAPTPAIGTSRKVGSPTNSYVEDNALWNEGRSVFACLLVFLLPASARLRSTRIKNTCSSRDDRTVMTCCQGHSSRLKARGSSPHFCNCCVSTSFIRPLSC